MCDPVSIGVTMAAVSDMSAVAGFVGQNQAAAANKTAAGVAYGNTANQLGVQGSQVDAQQGEQDFSAQIKAASQRGLISSSAGSMGLDYATSEEAGQHADFEVGRDVSIQDLNSANRRQQISSDLVGADLKKQSQINSVQPGNPVSLVLGLAKAGLSGAGGFSQAGGRFTGGADAVGANEPVLV